MNYMILIVCIISVFKIIWNSKKYDLYNVLSSIFCKIKLLFLFCRYKISDFNLISKFFLLIKKLRKRICNITWMCNIPFI